MMVKDVNSDEFITLLLKCVGSKYPIKILFKDNHELSVFVIGFLDASCSTLKVVSSEKQVLNISLLEIKGFISPVSMTLGTLRGSNFHLIDN